MTCPSSTGRAVGSRSYLHRRFPLTSTILVKEQSKTRPLVLIGGFIHDLSSFMDQHPGGRGLLSSNIGKDATAAFLGGVYEHSHAAHNVCFYPFGPARL